MSIKSFEEIIAWQKARELTKQVYKTFAHCKDYSFKNQMERASVSIMNNIAEGFERQTNKEFRNFLFIAKGSSGEVRSMSILAQDLKYIIKEDQLIIYNQAQEISRILSGFIKTL